MSKNLRAAFFIFFISLFLLASLNLAKAEDIEDLAGILRQRIQELQEQIVQLQSELNRITGELVKVEEAIEFSKTMVKGTRGGEVENLQKFLSKHPDVYPEGLVTGYFGSLTEAAVKRFQEKYANEILKPLGFIEGTGVVGNRTLEKLNEVARATPAVPAIPATPAVPGVSPAIPAVPATPALPATPAAATTTPVIDTTLPTISNISANNITSSGAAIIWTTNEAADSQVEYGITMSYGNLTGLDASLVISHLVSLSNLQANTTYHYRVKSKDAAGNLAVSYDYAFTTGASVQTSGIPSVISNVTLGWYKGGSFSNSIYQLAMSFEDSSNASSVQSYRVYLKKPGETTYSLAATFNNPASILATSAGGCTEKIKSNGWQLRYCSNNGYWQAFDQSGPATNYPIGEYSFYIAVTDASGNEVVTSSIAKNIVLDRTIGLSPVGQISSTTPAFRWTVASGWSTNIIYALSIYDASNTLVWWKQFSVDKNVTEAEGIYAGPALVPGKTYAFYLWGEGQTAGNERAFTMSAGNQTFTVSQQPSSVTVISPNGGECRAGIFPITWSSPLGSEVSYWNLSYSIDNGASFGPPVYGGSDYNVRSHYWALADNVDSNQSLIKVQAYTSNYTSLGFDVSDNIFSLKSTCPGGTAPAAPTNLTATPQTYSDGALGILLRWTDNSDNELGFATYMRVQGSSDWGSPSFNTWPIMEYVRLQAGTTYEFKVRAGNQYGYSADSNIVIATVGATPKVTVISPNGGECRAGIFPITWSSPLGSEVAYWDLSYSIDNGASFWYVMWYHSYGIRSYNWASTDVVARSDANSDQALIKIKARGAGFPNGVVLGEDTSDNVFSIKSICPGGTAPAAPTNLTATPKTYSNGTQAVTIRWTDNSDNELGFATYKRAQDSSKWDNPSITMGTAMEYQGFQAGTTYEFKVRSGNQYGYSADSDIITAMAGTATTTAMFISPEDQLADISSAIAKLAEKIKELLINN